MPLTSGLWVRNSQAEARAHPELREKLKIELRHSPEKGDFKEGQCHTYTQTDFKPVTGALVASMGQGNLGVRLGNQLAATDRTQPPENQLCSGRKPCRVNIQPFLLSLA